LHRNLLTGVRPRVTLSRIGAQQCLPRRRLRGLLRNTRSPSTCTVAMPAFRGRRVEGLARCVSVTSNMGGIPDVKTAVEGGGLGPVRLDLHTRAYPGQCPGARALEDAERVR